MLVAGTTLGPYKILAPLGAGGMGEVYRARDTRLGRDVAIKVIPPELARDSERIRRFEQEARAAGALSHPNVCSIFDVGTHDGAPFVVMELLEGETLRERLDAGPIPARRAIEYAVQVAHGLAAAHEKGIVHRDLKPENLFVMKDGRVKVLDFGLAKLTRPELLAPSGEQTISILSTETGAILGTAGYMAPEQARGRAADARSDLFALGAILYEALTGKRVFRGASYVETAHAILNEEPAPLAESGREFPPGLEPIVRRCLEKQPGQRFQSASDLAFALGAAISTGQETRPRPAVTRGRRGIVAAVLVSMAAVVVLGLAMGYLIRGRSAPAAGFPSFHRLTFHRGTVFAARFVHHDRSILYGASWKGNATRVYSVIPGTPESRALTADGATVLAVSATGDMALKLRPRRFNPMETDGTLAQAPFGGGTPREILDGVIAADWSPDGSALAIVRRVEGQERLEYPAGRILYRTRGWISDPRVSPRGSHIAFLDHPQVGDEAGSVAIVDLAGRKTALSGPWGAALGLAWSPDGGEVWFTAEQGSTDRALHAVTLSRKERLVLRQAGALTLHDIAPDGRVLLSQDDTRIGLVGLDRSQGKERDLSWLDWSLASDLSSDGGSILFTEMSTGVGGQYTVYLRKIDGSPAVRLGQGWAEGLSADGKWGLSISLGPAPALVLLPTGAGGSRALERGSIERYQWATLFPDGRRVLFAGNERGHGTRLYVQDLAGGGPRLVGPEETGAGYFWNPISPDGMWVALPGPRGEFIIRSIGGTRLPPVPGLNTGEFPIRWTEDGRGLYVFSQRGSRAEIKVVDLSAGKRSPWRTIGPEDPSGLIHFGPICLTPDGRTYAYNYFRVLSDLYVVEGLK